MASNVPARAGRSESLAMGGTTNLADILERILDKGIVIAGDITINLVDIELLTIKVRLLIASADKAREMGIDWWEGDPFLSSSARSQLNDGSGNGNGRGGLEQRLDRIEHALEQLTTKTGQGSR